MYHRLMGNFAKRQARERAASARYYERNRDTINAKRRSQRAAQRAELIEFEDANAATDHSLDCDPPWCSVGCNCIPCRSGTALSLDTSDARYIEWQSQMAAQGTPTNPRYR